MFNGFGEFIYLKINGCFLKSAPPWKINEMMCACMCVHAPVMCTPPWVCVPLLVMTVAGKRAMCVASRLEWIGPVHLLHSLCQVRKDERGKKGEEKIPFPRSVCGCLTKHPLIFLFLFLCGWKPQHLSSHSFYGAGVVRGFSQGCSQGISVSTLCFALQSQTLSKFTD